MAHFHRYEKKYLISAAEQAKLLPYISKFTQLDKYSKPEYLVTSLYYDTHDFSSFSDSLEGNDTKKKFRIRYYGKTPHRHFLEVKSKIGLKSYKSRTEVSELNPIDQFKHGFNCISTMNSNFTYYFFKLKLNPVIWVQYTRSAFNSIHTLDNVRITFDKNIFHSCYNNSTTYPTASPLNKIFSDKIIMEVKANDHPPSWAKTLMRELKEKRTPFSKYVNSLKKHPTSRGLYV